MTTHKKGNPTAAAAQPVAERGMMAQEAIWTKEPDLTEGSLAHSIWILAVPMILEQLTISAFRLLDTFWVGKLGPAALAAVSVSGTVIWTVNQVGMGLGVGAAAIVARRIGERDSEGANVAVVQALLVGAVVSVVCGVAGFLLADDAMIWLGAESDVIPLGTSYLRISFAGFLTITFVNLINGMLRGAGNAKHAMWVLMAAGLVHIVVEPFLIFGFGPLPPLHSDGAAAAFIISRSAGIAFQLYILLTGRARISLRWQRPKVDLRVIASMIRIATPSTLQLTTRMSARVVILGLVALFGTTTIAGYGVAQRLTLTILIPAFGLANVATTLVGQNLGAKKPRRAERSAWTVAVYNMILMGSVGAIFFLLAEQLVGIFSQDPTVIEVGGLALRVMALVYIFNALGASMGRALDGAGDTVPPMVINMVSLVAWQLVASYVLAIQLGWGPMGIWVGLATGTALNGTLLSLWFRRGRWKLREV